MTRLFPLYVTTILAGFMMSPASALPDTQSKSLAEHAKTVAAMLEGKMDTILSSQSPNASSVRMTTCRVQVTNANTTPAAIFLYQEQAILPNLAQPYRQRFLEIAPYPAIQRVRSLAFKPASSQKWIGYCNQPASKRVVQLQDLGEPICSVFLVPQKDSYIGHTPPEGCPANVRGAVRITNQIELTASGMKTWDRGFDVKGQQVWGAKNEAYQYRRIKD